MNNSDRIAQLSVYHENVGRFPIPDEDRKNHMGDLVARSLNGVEILAYGSTIDELEQNLMNRYRITILGGNECAEACDSVLIGRVS